MPACFIFEAVDSSTSNTIGIVHGMSFESLPLSTTLSKSCWDKNPSKGLKMPSAIFSTSLARSALIGMDDKPAASVFDSLLTRLPPWGLETPVS